MQERVLTFNDSIIYPFLGGKDHVEVFFSVLEAFGLGFDSPVPVQHV